MVQRIECDCGFAVEAGEDEAVEAARCHAQAVHGIELGDGLVRALARPVAAARKGKARTTTTNNQSKGRKQR